jgi:hypothetical protein
MDLADRRPPPQVAEMSCYSADSEITSICADFVVELRGIEPPTSAFRIHLVEKICNSGRFVIMVVRRITTLLPRAADSTD